ncbi:hypothetical protein INR49_006933 [Caranx melampygus]|nr:hypothetical protein INR49_006933 [Caranx melampygus]
MEESARQRRADGIALQQEVAVEYLYEEEEEEEEEEEVVGAVVCHPWHRSSSDNNCTVTAEAEQHNWFEQ